MSCPKFIVFVVGKGLEGEIITRVEKRGYHALVDSIHGGEKVFFEQIVGQWRGYYFQENTLVAALVPQDFLPFDFCIVFDKSQAVTEEDFEFVDAWVDYFINPKAVEKGIEEKALKAEAVLKKPVKLNVEAQDLQLLSRELPSWYDLKMKEVKKGMLYEVTKPHTDMPYVVLNWNWSKSGHLDFFTSLFVCTSWGVCSDDVAFLKQCWEKLEMAGDFDMDQLLNERVERCNKGEAEPRVWRNYIDNVDMLLSDCITKRKDAVEGGAVKRIK